MLPLLLAASHTAPLPPAPNVQLAVANITATLNWMHSTQKTGGLGYSIAQTQKTHAYQALLALDGTWPA